MSIIFPDEDFCIYVDFPFNQFVVHYESIKPEIHFIYKEKEFTCNYLWLVQYYELYYEHYLAFNIYINGTREY